MKLITSIEPLEPRIAPASTTNKGSATNALIAAGTQLTAYAGADNTSGPATYTTPNPDAGIGKIFIGGNFVMSNVFAGVKDGGMPGVENTASGDTLAVGDASRTAKLGPVVIKGHLLSDRTSMRLSGFAADVIASITVNERNIFAAGDGLRNFDAFITAKEL